jgi:imidazolonepropionase-like amidohydrolase
VLFSLPLLANNIAIVNATVHTMGKQGSLNNATVLVRDGVIQTVLPQTPALVGYQMIDAKGKVVTPGLIGAYTSLGLVEVGASAGTVDGNSAVTAVSTTGAALDVSYAINPASSLFAISRIEGITSAATSMSDTKQLFKGQGAFISLAGDENTLLKGAAFITAGVDNNGADDAGGSRASLWVALEQALAEAEYSVGKVLTPETQWHGLTSIADASALQAVIKGQIPLLIEAHRVADLSQIIALKSRHPKLNIVVLRATEGWKVAAQLAKANIPVILDPESNLPNQFERLAATLQNAARLHQAGVTVAIGMNTHNIRLAKQHAGNAVSHGLPWEAGLAALTINAAKIYGMSDQLGSIEKGKRADLVIWSGDPLEVTENAEIVMINGEIVDMTSRQSKLRDRYLQEQQGKAVQYLRP